MNQSMCKLAVSITLSLFSASAIASAAVDVMSDNEVSEYAMRMSSVMEEIRDGQLCLSDDVRCISAEFARHGISYADKEPVIKRLSIMIGSIH